ncbi:MAG: hypothetical protein B7X92_07930 [Novosphingobium sp. 17-62-9]|nr:MAG: hypothetical protein B7X92_07930 [Novosphingobium sp. 17-62-9]
MRVAVLSLIEAGGSDPAALRGYLPIGGRSVLRHQIGLALSFNAKRIVIMAEAISGELVALQHVAEAGGAQFHVVPTVRALVPLIAPEDDVIVFGDGLLAMPDALHDLVDAGPVVLTLPIEPALPLGFERIDINHASAGVMRFAGRIAAGLADLPPEWNPQSALLRLAIQGGGAQRNVPAAMLDDGRWGIVRNEQDAQIAERRWLRLHTRLSGDGAFTLGERLAALMVNRFGPALLHAGTRPALLGLAAGALGLLGGGVGWLGQLAVGFVLLGLAWLVEQVASLLGQVERASLLASGLARRSVALFHLLIDAGFVTLAGWGSGLPTHPSMPPGAPFFVPLTLLMCMRLIPLALPGRRWSRWLSDRFMIGAALAAIHLFLPWDATLGIGVILLLGIGVFSLQFGHKRSDPEGPPPASPNPRLTTRQ